MGRRDGLTSTLMELSCSLSPSPHSTTTRFKPRSTNKHFFPPLHDTILLSLPLIHSFPPSHPIPSSTSPTMRISTLFTSSALLFAASATAFNYTIE